MSFIRATFSSFIHKAENPFKISLYSLGIFRILAGVILFAYYLSLYKDFSLFFFDSGILPSEVLTSKFWLLSFKWSLYFLSGNEVYCYLLYFSGILFSVLLILGYKIRWVTFISWLLLVSIHNRNPLLINAGDRMLQLLLFWMIFLPSSAFGLDRCDKKEHALYSFSTIAILVQVLIIYFFSASLKTGAEWRVTGTALNDALSLSYITTDFGKWLLSFPVLLKAFTFFTFYLELFGPLIILIPFYNSTIRWIVLICFMAFHLATLLTFHLELFPLVGMAAWVLFVPHNSWLKWKNKISKESWSHFSNKWYDFISGALIIYLLIYNWRSLDYKKREKILPVQTNVIAQVFQIQQRWGLFAPFPSQEDGYLLAIGINQKNEEVELINSNNNSGLYHSSRWKKYYFNLYYDKKREYAKPFADYLIRANNLKSVKIIFVKTVNGKDSQSIILYPY